MSLSLRDISFTYPGGARPVLEGVCLEVADGQSVAVTAPSGRGKSTLLSIAGLLLSPDSGQVLIDGRPCTPRLAQQMLGDRVQWVFQSVSLLPRRSVIDNVALPALAHGVSRRVAEVRAGEVLRSVGLEPTDREARTLSGGQAQRAGVARALMTRPSLIVADEPTANLDAITAVDVARVLFAAPRRSLLVATHDPAVAAFADVTVSLADMTSGDPVP